MSEPEIRPDDEDGLPTCSVHGCEYWVIPPGETWYEGYCTCCGGNHSEVCVPAVRRMQAELERLQAELERLRYEQAPSQGEA